MAAGVATQELPLHDVPDSEADRDALLADIVAVALKRANAHPEGSLERPDADDLSGDMGDTNLGVASLLALAHRRRIGPAGPVRDAVRRAVAFHLRERVFTEDNPGYPNLLVRGFGVAHARYTLRPGAHPVGDWPSTVWALLQAVDVLDLNGGGLLEEAQAAELLEVCRGYWRWLTRITVFDPQHAGNQALGAVVGGLMLARHLTAADGEGAGEGAAVRRTAMRLYRGRIRTGRIADRGCLLIPEHGGPWDNNYGPITLSFLAQAHRVSGEPEFAEDGEEAARYLDARLSVSGYDVGGARYSEKHCGFEGALGLRYFGARIGADLGRYRGDGRLLRHSSAGSGGELDGHFAFMTVWQLLDGTPWHRHAAPSRVRHALRRGAVSVSFDDVLAPAHAEVGGTVLLPAAVDRQHGIGVLLRAPGHRPLLAVRPFGTVRCADAADPAGAVDAKLVVAPVVTRDQDLVTVRTLYATDGVRLWVVALLPADGVGRAEARLALGFPYAAVPRGGGAPVRLDAPGELGAGLAVHHPEPGGTAFRMDDPRTREEAGFALAADPRGYGDPDEGWSHIAATSVLEAAPLPRDAVPEGLLALAAVLGPAPADPSLTVSGTADAPVVRTSAFTAVLGPTAGDDRCTPLLTLTPTAP
ncbi:hypothetical protein BIV57_21975 [Mangrovactinospora gilvigrisea]|uniref:Uncharacterized protein n=1 Tax=Mangrovactinospora gilvigrisea TaxID=1428644 RepID=A0A1J7BPE7_9ACTN|nr:hypothetical protein [Mangrovactinospora gilvigrisea]OIV35321.1 hypothetical protein BIV57_21975 [Mangrovactinospora gilvigrisea]